MQTARRIIHAALIGITLGAMLGSTTACSVSQAKVNQVVTDIKTWAPIVSSDAAEFVQEVATFEPADAAALTSFANTLTADSQALTTACTQYLTAPSSTLMAQIAAMVGTLATTDAQGLLAVAQVKNPQSQQTARGVLTLIATAVSIASGLLQSINVQPSASTTVALRQLAPYVDRAAAAGALAQAKTQGLAPPSATLEAFGL